MRWGITEKLIPYELGVVSTEISESTLSLRLKGDISLDIGCFLDGGDFDLDLFEFFYVSTTMPSESKSGEIKPRGGGGTLGYVFPKESLSFNSVLKGDDKWVRAYARAASLSILCGKANLYVNQLDLVDWETEVDITKILPDNFAVVVLGKENLGNEGYDAIGSSLMLQEYGLNPYHSGAHEFLNGLGADVVISIPKISPNLKGNEQVIAELLSTATHITMPAARFITVYQVVELLLAKVFNVLIDQAIKDKSLLQDTWKLRDRLTELAKEKWRLGKIRSDFLNSEGVSDRFSECHKYCCDLLDEIADDHKAGDDWAKSLYLVRNRVVHRQHEFLNAYNDKLTDICDSLYLLCFTLIERYKE